MRGGEATVAIEERGEGASGILQGAVLPLAAWLCEVGSRVGSAGKQPRSTSVFIMDLGRIFARRERFSTVHYRYPTLGR